MPPLPSALIANKRLIFASLLTMAALAMPASAQECVCPGCGPDHTANTALTTAYVDRDECGNGCVSIVLYEEANGIDGLQRFDAVQDWTCGGLIPPDLLHQHLRQ